MSKPMRSRLFAALLLALAFGLLAPRAAADIAKDGKIVIVVDPGHGGIDGGTDAGVRTEKENNLVIAKALKTILENDGRFTVILTRDTDVYLTYLERSLIAKENNADLFFSLHCNSSPESYPNGNMAYISVIDRFAAEDLAGMVLFLQRFERRAVKALLLVE